MVIARSFWAAIVLYAVSIGSRELLDPAKGSAFDSTEARRLLLDTQPWFGAMFAACYASLYARFSSQWSYLAGLYNQIKAAEARASERDGAGTGREVLAQWKAAFIEDADELHLSAKPIFAGIIAEWGKQADVRHAFIAYTPGGDIRLAAVLSSVDKFTVQHARVLRLPPRDPGT